MTQTSYPFDSGAGANVGEDQWAEMASQWMPTGVIGGLQNELAVSQHAGGANKSVDVATGNAWVVGFFYDSDAVENLAIADNSSGNPRIDLIVLRRSTIANSIILAVLTGTPAVSPAAPALTQNTAVWEIAIGQIAVANGFATIVTANITDARRIVQPLDSVMRINTQTADYTLLSSDAAKIVELNKASAINLTVPPNASVQFPIGTQITISQIGAGQVTVVAGAGVTIRTPDTLKLSEQYALAALYKRGTDEWVLGGNLALS